MPAALVTVPLFWGVYWSAYENMKAYLLEQVGDSESPDTNTRLQT